MDAFSYLSVLLSIIVGLAITQVLQGFRGLLLARRQVRMDAVPLIWSILLLLFATQAWWASFGLRTHADWNFAGFSVLLLQMIMLYMMTAVVLPDTAGGVSIDLSAHWNAERRPFFAFLLAVVTTSLLKDLVLDGHFPGRANIAFHILLAMTAVLGIALRDAAAQRALAATTTVGFALYVAFLFARL